MKTSINLYVPSLKPVKLYLTLNNVAIATLLVILAVGALYGNVYMQQLDVDKKAQVIKRDSEFAQQELKNFEQALLKHNDTATYNDLKLKLERDLLVKQTLLKMVATQGEDEVIDYYQLMKDLTEHHDHDLWLTSFRFNQQNVLFNGYAVESKAVTQWLTYLQNTETFKGREFSLLDIKAIDPKVLRFQAATSESLIAPEVKQ